MPRCLVAVPGTLCLTDGFPVKDLEDFETLAVVDGELERRRGMDVLGPVQLDDDRVRSIIRFDYADGTVVAGALRAALVKLGSGRRGGPPAGPRRAAAKLTVRFDDPEPF